MATITIKNVTKAFGDNIVLRDFNETFQDGEFIMVSTRTHPGNSDPS